MARILVKQKAVKLRLEGKSYSEIKNLLGISKSTLSGWLEDYPLSKERIKELRDWNPRRIENFRNTMRNK
ncbi:MAG: helix-turn-helix domain containing protein, partial [Candidatus Vogelbacteria bacterium]|nr:helix-turn-helix domain containing protein [Candidatus Vogelbacteria bacterium]